MRHHPNQTTIIESRTETVRARSDVTTWQTWSVLRIPDQRPRPANKLPTDVSRAAAKRTTGAGAVDDQVAHVAHFTAAVYTGFHAAEERLQSQIHTLEGGHGQTAVCPNCRTPLGEPLAEIGVVNTPFIGQVGYSNNPVWTPQAHACVACVHLPGNRPERVVKPFCTGGEVWSLYTPGPRHWLVEGQPPPFCISRDHRVGATDPAPNSEAPYSREELTAVLETITQWQFASTYSHPNDRHDYTIARWWGDRELYDRVIQSMWNHVEDVWFKLSWNDQARRYSSFVSNGWRYWSFPPQHEGINRCVHVD